MRDPESIAVNEDERMIPVWSIMLPAWRLCCGVLLLDGCARTAPPRSAAARLPHLLQPFLGRVDALYFLMLGYISKDSPRRGMSARFWMLICFVMPAASGRCFTSAASAAGERCPACGTHVQSDFHFCPQCNYQLTANCGNCFGQCATDQYCTRCGHELAEDHMPTRLHLLGD